LSRLEFEGNPPNKYPFEEGPINLNQFRSPFNSQIFRRERRNEEQSLRPPVKNNNDNNLIEDFWKEEYVDFK